MLGPGKLDDWCTKIRAATGAAGVIVIAVGPTPETRGFSSQLDLPDMLVLPDMLESIAAQIRADLKRGEL
jgi:hypothetical protein